MLDAAMAGGIDLVDTSNSYAGGEAERIIGAWLHERKRRDDVLIATKVFYPTGPGPDDRGLSRAHILRACEDSLRRLQTDYIDLYQTHRPDPTIPLEETLRALHDLVAQGKVRYVGSSTAPAWHLVEALMTSQKSQLVPFVSEQSPYNLLDRRIENELVPACERHGVGILAWSPLAMGMLAGRYASAETPPAGSRKALRGGIYGERVTARGVDVGNRFAALARAAGHEPAQAAVLWVRDQPGIAAPIVGPRTLEQLKQQLATLGLRLCDDLRARCDELVPPGSVAASFFNTAAWMRQKTID
jgi:aryl-alcohol dehydrogenase-like predicted oxidoreductase